MPPHRSETRSERPIIVDGCRIKVNDDARLSEVQKRAKREQQELGVKMPRMPKKKG